MHSVMEDKEEILWMFGLQALLPIRSGPARSHRQCCLTASCATKAIEPAHRQERKDPGRAESV